MAEMTLRQRTHKYLKARKEKWVNGGEMERLALDAGYKGSTISRELRRMAEESYDAELDLGGFLLREERPGQRVRSVWYCWVPEKTPQAARHQTLEINKRNIENFDREYEEERNKKA